ncbi:AEC family transporter [Amaricoccus macauensis]|uniref:AEC family transporter n=1 Tax=Amaricoccus macauensis TaxID=57001 RepID=UPI003C7EB3EA
MLTNLLIVLPIFALILTGWIARRTNALGPHATREVNRFVVWLALPALLFDIMASATPSEIWQPGFILAFSAGAGTVFALTLALRMRQGRGLADAGIDALNASYPNTGYMGVPLMLAIVGPEALAVTLVSIILTVCVLFGVAIACIEAGLQSQSHHSNIARQTFLALVRNPLIVAPAAGTVVMITGLPLPDPLARFLDLLGGAASPCALIALGLFLADSAGRRLESDRGTAAMLMGFKLLLQPALTWVVAALILRLPPETTHMVVILSALPTGTGPFMLAEYYGRGALITARVVLATTILSILTLSAYLAVTG